MSNGVLLDENSLLDGVEWNSRNVVTLLSDESELIFEPDFYFTNEIRFSDNFWDFRHLDKVHNKNHFYYFDFNILQSIPLRVLLKKIIIRDIYLNHNKIKATKSATYHPIKRFFFYLENNKLIYDPKQITPRILKGYIEENLSHVSKRTLQWNFTALKKIFIEMEFSGINLDYQKFDLLMKVDKKRIKAQIEANKTPNIPKKLFKKIKEWALKDIDDSDLTFPQRMIACLITILSYTGMRGGEVCLLEANRLREIAIKNGGKKANYLEIFTYKTTLNKAGRWSEAFAYDETVHAYKTLESITAEARNETNTPFLYIGLNSFGNSTKGKRLTYATFGRNIDVFFYRHQQTLGFDSLPNFEKTLLSERIIDNSFAKSSSFVKKEEIGDTFFTINPHQFPSGFRK